MEISERYLGAPGRNDFQSHLVMIISNITELVDHVIVRLYIA